jgi:hypothetical protein
MANGERNFGPLVHQSYQFFVDPVDLRPMLGEGRGVVRRN